MSLAWLSLRTGTQVYLHITLYMIPQNDQRPQTWPGRSLSEKNLFYISYSISLECPHCSTVHDTSCFFPSLDWHTCLCALNEDWDLTFFFEIGLMKPWAHVKRQHQDTDGPARCCNPVEENKFFIKADLLCLRRRQCKKQASEEPS